MSVTIERILTMHCINHKQRGTADAVWGEVLCSESDIGLGTMPSYAAWKIISFDGRRGGTIVTRTKYHDDASAAQNVFFSKWLDKRSEGYVDINWISPYYGLMPTIRNIDPDFFDMVIAESTRPGMDTSSDLWASVNGTSGLQVMRDNLIDNFNKSNKPTGSSREVSIMTAREALARSNASQQEQRVTAGRFPPDPSIGQHIFLWKGQDRDRMYERCGVCSKKLSRHQRLVVNHRSRLARHIAYLRDGILCSVCNLPRGDEGRLVHSAYIDKVEYITDGSVLPEVEVTTTFETRRAVTPTNTISQTELDAATDYIGGVIELEIEKQLGSQIIGNVTDAPEPIKKPKALPKKQDAPSYERTGGLLDFDI